MNKFRGTGVAMVTPFLTDKKVDFAALERMVKYMEDGGVDYIVALGTTAETPCLSKEEKKDIVSCIVSNSSIPVVLGMSGNNTAELLNTMISTDLKGISAFLSAAPYYNKPTQEGIYQHFAAVAKESPLPIILYNVPGRTGVNILPKTICRLASDFKNFIGVKEASGSVSQIMQVVAEKPEGFTVISGDDGLTLPLISAGVEGVISVAANAFQKEWSTMVNACLENKFEEARKIHYKFLQSVELMFKNGNPAGIKEYLGQLGLTGKDLRLPLVNVEPSVANEIAADIKRISK